MKWFKFHLGDWAGAVHGLTPLEEGIYLRLVRWSYANESPLPLAMLDVRKIAGCMTPTDREATARVAERFFVVAEDGRHMRRIDAEITRSVGRYVTRSGTAKSDTSLTLPGRVRQRALREARAEMFDSLAAIGLRPPYSTPTRELRLICAERHVVLSRDALRDENVTAYAHVAPLTKSHNSLPSVESRGRAPGAEPAPSPEPPAPAPDPLPEIPPFPPRRSPAVEAAMAMRAAGMADVNPSHPDLLRLAATGLPPEHFGDAAKEAVRRSKSFAYTLALIDGRLRDSAASRPLPGHVSLMEKWAPGLVGPKKPVFGPEPDAPEDVPPDAPRRRLGFGP